LPIGDYHGRVAWLILGAAIAAEVMGTLSLRASEGFSRLIPSVLVVVGYLVSFVLLAQVLKYLPVGVVYAVWAATGIALVSILGWVMFGDAIPPLGILGIVVILGGVVMLQLSGAVRR
jgi:small multidrug resistance pump